MQENETDRFEQVLKQHGPHAPVTLGMLAFIIGYGEPAPQQPTSPDAPSATQP